MGCAQPSKAGMHKLSRVVLGFRCSKDTHASLYGSSEQRGGGGGGSMRRPAPACGRQWKPLEPFFCSVNRMQKRRGGGNTSAPEGWRWQPLAAYPQAVAAPALATFTTAGTM